MGSALPEVRWVRTLASCYALLLPAANHLFRKRNPVLLSVSGDGRAGGPEVMFRL